MQKLFGQEVRFKADNGSEFPEWEEKYLSDIASFHSGLTYTPDDVVDSENGILVLGLLISKMEELLMMIMFM